MEKILVKYIKRESEESDIAEIVKISLDYNPNERLENVVKDIVKNGIKVFPDGGLEAIIIEGIILPDVVNINRNTKENYKVVKFFFKDLHPIGMSLIKESDVDKFNHIISRRTQYVMATMKDMSGRLFLLNTNKMLRTSVDELNDKTLEESINTVIVV